MTSVLDSTDPHNVKADPDGQADPIAPLRAMLWQGRKSSRVRKPLPDRRTTRVLAEPLAPVSADKLITIVFTPYPPYTRTGLIPSCEECGHINADVTAQASISTRGSMTGEMCSDCFSTNLAKLVFTAERFNLATFNGDRFSHDMRGMRVLLDMTEFQQRTQQRRKDKRDSEQLDETGSL